MRVSQTFIPEAQQFELWHEYVRNYLGVDIVPVSSHSFFAEVARTRVKEVTFAHLRCRGRSCGRKDVSVRQAAREAVIISIPLHGSSRVMQDGREVELRPGDLYFCDTTRPFSATMDEEYEAISLDVPHAIWVRRIGPTEQIAGRVVRGNNYVGGLALNFFRQLIPGIGTVERTTADRLVETSLAMVSSLADTVSQDAPHSSGRILLLCRAKTLIEENLYDPSLDTEKIARALRISTRYLQYLFQEEGTSVCNWIWERRLEKCRQSLSDPLHANKNVSDIAFSCGFSDFSHFSHRFKAEYSISPSEFRRKQLANKLQ